MTANAPKTPSDLPNRMAEALAKNEAAADAVQHVADELGVVHAVLSKEVAKIVGEGDERDAADAVERTAALEKKLAETAEKMSEVNEALADQHASVKHLMNAK